MNTLNQNILILFVIQLSTFAGAIDFDEGCFVDDTPLLQMAFVMDQTGTFFGFQGPTNFYKEFGKLAPKLMEEVDKDYPGTQFALTTHADWDRDAGPDQNPSNAHTLKEGCYNLTTKFTTNRTLFQKNLGEVGVLSSGKKENALAALAFTAADKNIGWIRNVTSADGRRARRVMVLITDRDSGDKLGNPGNRGDFKGDGTDTCSTSKIPTHKILKEVFERYQMSIIGLLAMSDGSGNLIGFYKKHFETIGDGVKYCGRTFALKSNGVIWTNITSEKQIPSDFWKNQKKMYELEEKMETAGYIAELKASHKAKSAVAGVKAGPIDNLIKFVIDCLKETKTDSCLFGDPEGYNTLGF